jgi:hypothetical protein
MPSEAVEETIAIAIDAWKRDEFPSKDACCWYYGIDYQPFLARLNRRPTKNSTSTATKVLTY